MLSSKLPFPTGWYGTEIPGYRICHETYERYPVDFLPPIPEELLDGTFSWLLESPLPGESRCEVGVDADFRQRFHTVVEQARDLSLALPTPFLRFMGDATLRCRTPGISHPCVPDTIVRCPDAPGFLVMCRADCQGILFWFVYVDDQTRDHCVLTSAGHFGMNWDEEHLTWDVDDPEHRFCVSAHSFEEFVYREWIESSAAASIREGKPLTPRQRQYVSFYKPEGASEVRRRRCEVHGCELQSGLELWMAPKASWYSAESIGLFRSARPKLPHAAMFQVCEWMGDGPPDYQIRGRAYCPECRERLIEFVVQNNLGSLLTAAIDGLKQYTADQSNVLLLEALQKRGL